jgi:RNA polymerase sigma-70 factor (sigma-E family)
VTSILRAHTTSPPESGVPIDADHGAFDDRSADAELEQLYDEHYVRLVRLAVLLLGDVGRAEDVVQDSFVAVYRRVLRSGGRDVVTNVPAYLRQTVVNRCRSVLRHLKVAALHPTDAPSPAPGADDDLLHGVRRRLVIDALARLPRRQREVLVLRHYLDLSEKEIAETLGISPGAVKSHASRGAAALRRTLSQLLEENA